MLQDLTQPKFTSNLLLPKIKDIAPKAYSCCIEEFHQALQSDGNDSVIDPITNEQKENIEISAPGLNFDIVFKVQKGTSQDIIQENNVSKKYLQLNDVYPSVNHNYASADRNAFDVFQHDKENSKNYQGEIGTTPIYKFPKWRGSEPKFEIIYTDPLAVRFQNFAVKDRGFPLRGISKLQEAANSEITRMAISKFLADAKDGMRNFEIPTRLLQWEGVGRNYRSKQFRSSDLFWREMDFPVFRYQIKYAETEEINLKGKEATSLELQDINSRSKAREHTRHSNQAKSLEGVLSSNVPSYVLNESLQKSLDSKLPKAIISENSEQGYKSALPKMDINSSLREVFTSVNVEFKDNILGLRFVSLDKEVVDYLSRDQVDLRLAMKSITNVPINLSFDFQHDGRKKPEKMFDDIFVRDSIINEGGVVDLHATDLLPIFGMDRRI